MVEVISKENADLTIRTVSDGYDQFVTVCGEVPNALLMSEVFAKYFHRCLNTKMDKGIYFPVLDEYRGVHILVTPRLRNPYFAWVKIEKTS